MNRRGKLARRAVGYVRLSVKRLGDNSVGDEGQEDRIRGWCANAQVELVKVVYDLDVSASSRGLRLNRPGIGEVRDLFAAGEADLLIADKVDRIARNAQDFLTLNGECEAYGAALATVKENLDMGTPGGKFVGTILAAFAEMESDIIAQRVADARETMRKQVRFGGGPVPYGYKSAPKEGGDGSMLVVVPEESAILNAMARRFIEGESLYSIGRWLTAEGIPSKRGGQWRTGTIRAMLTNHASVGRLTHKGKPLTDAEGLPIQAWKPALEPLLWMRVRDIMAENDEPGLSAKQREANVKKGRRVQRSRVLSGIALCAGCGRPLWVRPRKDDTEYACVSRQNGYKCPVGASILSALIESEVEKRLLDHCGSWETFITVSGASREDEQRLHDTNEAIATLGAEILEALSEDRDIVELNARRKRLQTRADDLTAILERPSTRLIPTGRTVADEWANLPTATARGAFLSKYLVRCEVAGAKRSRGGLGYGVERIITEWAAPMTEHEGAEVVQVLHDEQGEMFATISGSPEALAEAHGNQA